MQALSDLTSIYQKYAVASQTRVDVQSEVPNLTEKQKQILKDFTGEWNLFTPPPKVVVAKSS